MSDFNANAESKLGAGYESHEGARGQRAGSLNYYRAESLAGNIAFDESSDPAPLAVGGVGISVIAGHIGNGFRFTGGSGGVERDFPPHIPDPPVTVRFWFRAPNPMVDPFLTNGGIIIDLGFGQFVFSARPATGVLELNVAHGALILTSSINVDDQAWHRVIGAWDGTTAKLYIDDNAPDTAALSGRATFDGLWWHNGDTDKTYDGDELGVWGGLMWSANDLDYDWNSGTGRTWPDVLNIGLIG